MFHDLVSASIGMIQAKQHRPISQKTYCPTGRSAVRSVVRSVGPTGPTVGKNCPTGPTGGLNGSEMNQSAAPDRSVRSVGPTGLVWIRPVCPTGPTVDRMPINGFQSTAGPGGFGLGFNLTV